MRKYVIIELSQQVHKFDVRFRINHAAPSMGMRMLLPTVPRLSDALRASLTRSSPRPCPSNATPTESVGYWPWTGGGGIRFRLTTVHKWARRVANAGVEGLQDAPLISFVLPARSSAWSNVAGRP